ncbi:hypothetical protein Plo01_10180 [Planobispora longispora]|uniref:Uncharacterized protein n=1 Tax=Planobispora longispora TaxID=28887 RepID=A0A8J3RJ39_9ACTN|nr:hypothetical protein Plo01_10180 [Planobispora longispora]
MKFERLRLELVLRQQAQLQFLLEFGLCETFEADGRDDSVGPVAHRNELRIRSVGTGEHLRKDPGIPLGELRQLHGALHGLPCLQIPQRRGADMRRHAAAVGAHPDRCV